jgi:transposase
VVRVLLRAYLSPVQVPTTFVAGLRSTGVVAPMVLDGSITGEAFRAYVEQFLAPELAKGDVVAMDSLSAHKVGMWRMLTARSSGIWR